MYESEGTPEALHTLVNAFHRKKDHAGVAKYAELLFAETKDPRDIALAAEAELRAGNGDNFVRLFETYSSVMNRNVNFLRYYGWQLFRLGRLRDAKKISEEIEQSYPAHRDLQLEIAIAIETGEWETLARPLAAALDPSPTILGDWRSSARLMSHKRPAKDLYSTLLPRRWPRGTTIQAFCSALTSFLLSKDLRKSVLKCMHGFRKH